MSNDIFDYFGGSAERPEDSVEEELDLSDLEQLAKEQESAEPASDETSADSDAAEPVAEMSDQDAAGNEAVEPVAEEFAPAADEEPEAKPDETTHWLDLASSLGVAMASTEFEAEQPRPKPEKVPPKGKKVRSEKRPSGREDEVEEPVFGQGLLDEIEPTPDESRQQQLLADLFPPTEEGAYTEPAPSAPEEAIEAALDPDIVEFEIEELSSSGGWPSSTPPRESAQRPRAEQQSNSEDDDESVAQSEPVRRTDARPDRDEGRRGQGGRRRRRRPERAPGDERSPQRPHAASEATDDGDDSEGETRSEKRTDFRNVKFPTWNETISPIIESNLARRKKGKDRRRPRRGGR